MLDKGAWVPLPDLGDARYLWEWLHDLGLSKSGAMGPVPMDWIDLQAWQNGIGHRAQPWELRAMREASRNFVWQQHESEDPQCPPPWAQHASPVAQDQVAKQVSAIFGRHARPSTQRNS